MAGKCESVAVEFQFDEVPEIETERLTLRRITADDLDDWMAVWHSPGVLDYLIDFEGAPHVDMGREIVEWAERIFIEKSGIRWALALKPNRRMIGSCGFHLFDRRHQRVEIGYELHSDYWRQGLMSEALRAALEFCFDTLAVHRVEADVVEGNVASAALLKKAGFTLEGLWRDRVYKRGAFQSLWQYGFLKPEYYAKRR